MSSLSLVARSLNRLSMEPRNLVETRVQSGFFTRDSMALLGILGVSANTRSSHHLVIQLQPLTRKYLTNDSYSQLLFCLRASSISSNPLPLHHLISFE